MRDGCQVHGVVGVDVSPSRRAKGYDEGLCFGAGDADFGEGFVLSDVGCELPAAWTLLTDGRKDSHCDAIFAYFGKQAVASCFSGSSINQCLRGDEESGEGIA